MCTELNNSSQNIFIPSLNAWYPIENVINSAYRKVLDFKENAEKILEKEKLETLCLPDFAKAILDSRSFNISLQHYCIVLKCYITLEKDKDIKKKRNECTPPGTPLLSNSNSSTQLNSYLNAASTPIPIERKRMDSTSSTSIYESNSIAASSLTSQSTGGAKKVNVEVIMKSNPFRVDENEKTTRMELLRSQSDSNILRFTYYVKPEFEAKKFKDSNTEMFDKGKLIVFTNDFFTVYQNSDSGDMDISLNEIVQSQEEQKRTEALGEKLCVLLKDRPRHRALLTNECKLNHSVQSSCDSDKSPTTAISNASASTQEDETYYTRELIQIYGQPIVPSFHKYFNYQLSNTHYGYRTLRRLLNCDILKKFVKITKEEIKSLDRVVEFVQLTPEKCLASLKVNLTAFYDPVRFENGIVKEWLDVWYVDRLKEIHKLSESSINKEFLTSNSSPPLVNTSWASVAQPESCFLHTSNCELDGSECDQTNHLWFCLQDYSCKRMEELIYRLKDYIKIKNNRSELILVHTAHPVFEYKDVLTEARRILAVFLNKSLTNIALEELISPNIPAIAQQHVKNLLNKYINFDCDNKINGFTSLFEILMVLKRELSKEKNDEMKYSHFLCTLERNNQEKLKMAILQLKCVPCLNKFTTNFSTVVSTNPTSPTSVKGGQSMFNASSKNVVSHANMTRLLKQMSLIVSTELQQISIDLYEKIDDDKPVKFIRLKDELKQYQERQPQQKSTLTSSSSTSSFKQPVNMTNTNNFMSVSAASTNGNQKPQNAFIAREARDFLGKSSNNTPNFMLSHALKQPSNSASVNLLANTQYEATNDANKAATTTPAKFTPTAAIFNPHTNLKIITDKLQDMAAFSSIERNLLHSDRF